jgi:hypothetical protein
MQVILTEEEYLKLKNRSDEDRKTYVKRINVSIALQEMLHEMSGQNRFFMELDSERILKELYSEFMRKIELDKS